MTRPRSGDVVIGIGNIVRSDDGLGIQAVQSLRARRRFPGVELIDGGTVGLMLLPHIAEARRVIIVDAVSIGAAAGTLIRIVDAKGVFATGLTPHDVGLADLLDAARLTDTWPETLILHGLQPASTAIGTELTTPVAAALASLVHAIEADLSVWRDAACETDGRLAPAERPEVPGLPGV